VRIGFATYIDPDVGGAACGRRRPYLSM
jgi:hypothetical protein